VEDGIAPGRYRVRYSIRDTPLVSVIIPTRDRAELLERAIASVESQRYSKVEVIVVDNGSVEPETLVLLESGRWRWFVRRGRSTSRRW
jgi:cellulose synthase/poly-beta-1,6-N-acetylglucosamine synthase-like glycosyltransferase